MPDVIAAIDEGGANDLIQDAQAALGTLSSSGSGTLGPFTANWSATASFSEGTVDLIAPNVIRLADVRMDYTVSFSFSFDLSSIIPDFCLPRICIDIPFIGRVCTPRICIDWPTITIPVSHSSFVKFSADFNPVVTLVGGVWRVELVIAGLPFLQLGPAAAAIIIAIGAAAAADPRRDPVHRAAARDRGGRDHGGDRDRRRRGPARPHPHARSSPACASPSTSSLRCSRSSRPRRPTPP